MIHFMKRYQLPLFFILAFALSWLVWGTYIAEQQGKLSFHLPEAFFAYFALTAAVLIVAAVVGGRAAITDLLRRLFYWRVSSVWYAASVFVPIGLVLLTLIVIKLFGGNITLGAEVSLGAAVVYCFSFGAKLWVTEELAWRGFALPRLQARYNALTSAVILGLLWGLWHTPLFLIAGTGQSRWPFIGFVVFAIAESVLVSWIYNNTAGSLILVTIFHAVTDASLAFSGILSGDANAFWMAVIIHIVAAVVVVLITGSTRLSRHTPQGPAATIPPGYIASNST